jgi:hypothetical protein
MQTLFPIHPLFLKLSFVKILFYFTNHKNILILSGIVVDQVL